MSLDEMFAGRGGRHFLDRAANGFVGAVDVFFDPACEHVRYDECYKRSQQSIRACVRTAEELKVSICLENVWNKFLMSPLEAVRRLDIGRRGPAAAGARGLRAARAARGLSCPLLAKGGRVR